LFIVDVSSQFTGLIFLQRDGVPVQAAMMDLMKPLVVFLLPASL
jgi:hypothetical protein